VAWALGFRPFGKLRAGFAWTVEAVVATGVWLAASFLIVDF
jgi:hypothetical protein